MEDDVTPYELGSHVGLVLRYAIIIVLAVALFRFVMRHVRPATQNAVLAALVIVGLIAAAVVTLAGESFGTGDLIGLAALGVVMVHQAIRTSKRFRAGKTFK
jgi:protein-S-isoprenylcysteine O-methyltransferase Ste14